MKSAVLALFVCIPAVLSAQEESPTPVQYDVVGSFSFADYGYSPSFSPLSDVRVGGFDTNAAWDLAFHDESDVLFVINSFPAALTSLDITDPSSPRITQTLRVQGLTGAGLAVDNSFLVVVGAVTGSDDASSPGTALTSPSAHDSRGFVYVVAVSDAAALQTPADAKEAGVYLELEEPVLDVALHSGRLALLHPGGLFLANVEDLVRDDAPAADRSGLWTRSELAVEEADLRFPPKVEFSEAGGTVYVGFPAANRVARVDPEDGSVVSDGELGHKEFFESHRPVAQPNRPGGSDLSVETRPVGLDVSDRDGTISIVPAPVAGRFEPLDFSVIAVDGRELMVSANGGVLSSIDAARGAGEIGAVRIDEANLDPRLERGLSADFMDAFGRLFILPAEGDTDNDGDVEELVVSGARSFSIFDESRSPIFDSWDLMEHLVATIAPFTFNASPYSTRFDEQSPVAGPGPSAVAARYMGDRRVLVAVGLRSPGGVMFFRVRLDTNDVAFLGYRDNRNWNMALTEDGRFRFPERAGHLGPRRMIFLDPDPDTARPNLVLAVANHISGTVEFYEETSPYYWE